ncbi:MAG TPA: hypothetical protein VGS80_17370, partial [Ktedonobacterales bacterium]|nr:hypothetical protein [Ktedonobacterales bacterium]
MLQPQKPELWPGTQLHRPIRRWDDILSWRRVRDAAGAQRAQAVSVSRLLFSAAGQSVRSPASVASAALAGPVASCRWRRVLCPCTGSRMDRATHDNTS